MDSQIITVTVQAALFSALSSTLAQGLTVFRHQNLSSVDPVSFVNFMVMAIITTPLNYLYQRWLEDTFPTMVPDPPTAPQKSNPSSVTKEKFSVRNAVTKFFMDQSIGAAVNTVLFIFLFGMLKGKSVDVIRMDVRRDFWGMITDGWRVWPLVTILNLVVVPFDYRMLVGNTAGVIFGTYVNLKMM